ncbi:MAG: hypothetical protein V2I33_20155, partial [Kangiellaceae bacterium]|nr:hypothetical protein [Kangiellaceae bacterium]
SFFQAECTGCDWTECPSYCGRVELWVTPCGAIKATYLDQTFTSAEETYTGGWAFVELEYSRNVNGYMSNSDFDVRLNGVDVFNTMSNYLVEPTRNTNFHIGSYDGFLYHWNGFINYFAYQTILSIGTPNFTTTRVGGCNVCPVGGSCLSDCSYTQYIDGSGNCANCHAGCKFGCTALEAA